MAATRPRLEAKLALRTLARRYESLSEEMQKLDETLDHLTARANPALRGAKGVGVDVAAILLVAAGDNPERLRNSSAFAAMCGVNPIEASLRQDRPSSPQSLGQPPGQSHVMADRHEPDGLRRRRQDLRSPPSSGGRNQRDVVRCSSATWPVRSIASWSIPARHLGRGAENSARGIRHLPAQGRLCLGVSNMDISRFERGTTYSTELALRYEEWLSTLAPRELHQAA